MIPGVQIIGVVFSLIMIYMTYVYYKRNNYSKNSMILWLTVWILVLLLVSIPETVYGIMQALQIERTADFFVLAGFTFFSVIIFYMYVVIKKTARKMEDFVRETAIEEIKKKRSKRKK